MRRGRIGSFGQEARVSSAGERSEDGCSSQVNLVGRVIGYSNVMWLYGNWSFVEITYYLSFFVYT